MSAIQDEVFVRSAFYKFGIHAKNNKDHRGHSFRTDEKKGKKSIPRIFASVTVEILNLS